MKGKTRKLARLARCGNSAARREIEARARRARTVARAEWYLARL